MIAIEDWAEIRLHRAEGLPIKEIARRLGITRNTVRSALASDRPPRYERSPRGSVVRGYEVQIRGLLAAYPGMSATAIAERIGWPYTMNPLRVLLHEICPEYAGVDPVDRVAYEPGSVTQCDLLFPPVQIPLGRGQSRVLPVVVMVLGFSRFISAMMLPSRQGGDLLSGMWTLISQMGTAQLVRTCDTDTAQRLVTIARAMRRHEQHSDPSSTSPPDPAR